MQATCQTRRASDKHNPRGACARRCTENIMDGLFCSGGVQFAVAQPLTVSARVRLEVPLDRLWDFLSDTERLNRAVNLPAISFVPLPDPQKKGYYRAETSFLGVKVAYEEQPFEWVKGRYYQVERRFASGPLERVV